MGKIKLVKQSYLESKVKEDLGLIGIVLAVESEYFETEFEDKYFEQINRKLLKKSEKLGATHIFGIDYKITKDGGGWTQIFCYGDAYKSEEIIGNTK